MWAEVKTTSKREKWAKARGAVMQGMPLKPPREVERYYRDVLQRAVSRMVDDYAKELTRTTKPFVVQDASLGAQLALMFSRLDKRWAYRFKRLADRLAVTVVKRIDTFSRRSLNASLKEMSGGLTIKTPKLPAAMKSAIQASTTANVALIKSVQSQYHDKVLQSVMARAGDASLIKETVQPLVSQVYFTGETTAERAAFIARDQTAKLNSAMNVTRMKGAGIKQVRWRHSGASNEPRPLHVEYDGQIFDLDDPPIWDERTGERGWPGGLNCRCYLVPVLDFDD